MKPAFALNLSHDGIGLLRRTSRGWLSVGEVALDDPRLGESLDFMRKTALALSPAGLACKLIIPNSQILYTEIAAPGPDDATRRAQIATALEARTPYAVADLVFDWRGAGPLVPVAVVARETLAEAEGFAEQHRFGPLSFVAIPEAGQFPGEPFFGLASRAAANLPQGETLEPDDSPVRIIGRGEPAAATADAEGAEDPAPGPDAPAAPAPETAVADSAGPQATDADADGAAAAPEPAEAPAPDPVPAARARPPARRAARTSGPDDAAAGENGAGAAPVIGPATDAGPKPAARPRPSKPRAPATDRPASPPAEPPAATPPPAPDPEPAVGAFTAIGARIAERRADAMARGALIPALVAAAVILAVLLLWLILGRGPAEIDGMAEPAGPAEVETAIAAPPPLSPDVDAAPAAEVVATAPDNRPPEPPTRPAKPDAGPVAPEVAQTPAPADAPPVVSPEPPAQPTAASEAEAAPVPQTTAAAPVTAPPAQAPAATADPAPAAQDDPAPAATEVARAQPIDPDVRYELTGVWTVAPPATMAPAPDRPDAALRTERDRDIGTGAAATLLTAALPAAERPPAALPNPPPYAPPPRRDALGRIIPTPEGVVTAEGVTLFAGRPPIIAPERPAAAPAPEAAPETVADPIDAAPAEPDPLREFRPAPRPEDALPDQDAEAPETAPPAAADDTDGIAAAAPVPAADPALAGTRPRPPPAALRDTALAPAPETADPGPAPAADPALAEVRPRPPSAEALALAQAAAARAAQLAAASPAAVAISPRPAPRPRDFSAGIAAALQQAVAPQPEATAAAPTPAALPEAEAEPEPEARDTVPDIPTTAAVAREATVENALRLNELNLIGVYGTSGSRRALVRTPTGRFLRVEVGDRLDGGRVAAISETELSYVKNGRTIVLKMPREG